MKNYYYKLDNINFKNYIFRDYFIARLKIDNNSLFAYIHVTSSTKDIKRRQKKR